MRSLLTLFVFLLAACAGESDKPAFYSYTPPMTPGGMMCVDQCHRAHDYCAVACDLDYRACFNEIQAQAQKDFDAYARERFNAHLENDKNPSDFEQRETCLTSRKHCLADCDRPYNSCYNSCGGKAVNMTP